MATTITNFLVGLGMDATEFNKGQRDVTSGLDSLRSKALQLGALAGGAFGAKALTLGFAEAKDNMGKFAETFSVIPDDIQAMGNAYAQEGGSLEAFMSQIETLERIRASTPQQINALFAEAGIRGIDPSVVLNAESATEAYKNLADIFERLDPKQRLAAADVFGLDEASGRLLSRGRTELDAMIERQREIRPLTEEMTKAAADFNRQWKDINNNIGSTADRLSVGILPPITQLISDMDDWLDKNESLINSGIDTFAGSFADNINEIAVATGLLATGGTLSALAGMSKYIPLIGGGLATAATAAKTITGIGAAAAVSSVGADIVDNQLRENISGYDAADELFTKFVYDITGMDLSRGNVYEGGPQPTFNDPATRDMALEMLNRMNNNGTSSTLTPTQQQRSNNRPIEVKLMLDGQVIDKRIIDVSSQLDSDALEDITSSTGG